jgi:phosphoglycerate dehydrogenase-like enzyme
VSILLLETLHPEAEALLAAHAGLVRDPGADLAAVRAILTRGRGRIDQALMARCPSLRVIARAGAGLDNLDTQAAARAGVTVVYAPGANAATVAEHTLALMLDLVRGVTASARAVAAGRWEDRAAYRGNELRGLGLGIVGAGSIGRRVAELAAALGMRIAVARHRDREPPTGCATLPLPDLLAASDVVTLHLPLTPATRGCIGAPEFARMRPTAYLVNTSRGALIDHAALRAALAAGRIAGFAADVLDQEPPSPDDPLLRSDRVLLTPHVAALTATTYREVCLATARNVQAVLAGHAPEPRSVFVGPGRGTG